MARSRFRKAVQFRPWEPIPWQLSLLCTPTDLVYESTEHNDREPKHQRCELRNFSWR
jgi:hypothetical protein